MGIEEQERKSLIHQFRDDFTTLFNENDPIEAVKELLNSMPSAAAILNPDRKSVYVNLYLLNQLGHDSLEVLLGKRPGEMLGCMHALNNNEQCGISENCRMCGALSAIKQVETTKSTAISEMRLTMMQRGKTISNDLKVIVSPLILNDKCYMILYLNDISNEKRRKSLEKIFFHDVLNKIASLSGLSQLLKKGGKPQKQKQFLNTLDLVLGDLTNEIIAQRQLAAAENGELIVNKVPVFVKKLLLKVANQVKILNNPMKVSISISRESVNASIRTDATLLNRIVTNMIKNAIEASDSNGEITIKTKVNGGKMIISINNNSFMNIDTQLQVFQRSFSTKGDGRGLGTYSIKLLTERYLGGKVYFKSNKENGTTFFVELPVS